MGEMWDRERLLAELREMEALLADCEEMAGRAVFAGEVVDVDALQQGKAAIELLRLKLAELDAERHTD